MTEQELANVIWDIKEVIRNYYDDSEVEDVILPFTLLRRLDCVLEDKYETILNTLNDTPEEMRKYKLQSLMRQNGLTFFNMSGLSLKKLLNSPDQIGDAFKTYIEGFTSNVKETSLLTLYTKMATVALSTYRRYTLVLSVAISSLPLSFSLLRKPTCIQTG